MASNNKKKAPALQLKPDQRLGWHFLPANRKLEYGDDRKAEVGKLLKYTGTLAPKTCSRGMHASERAGDAARFGKGPVLCRVLVEGELDGAAGADKFCGRSRTVIWMKELSKADLVAACKASRTSTIADTTCTVDELVSEMSGGDRSKLSVWLEDWARKNGCVDVLPSAVTSVPVVIKPPLTEKVVRSLLSKRFIRTTPELRATVGDQFDESTKTLEDILDDLSWRNSVARIDYGRNGKTAWVLRDTK